MDNAVSVSMDYIPTCTGCGTGAGATLGALLISGSGWTFDAYSPDLPARCPSCSLARDRATVQASPDDVPMVFNVQALLEWANRRRPVLVTLGELDTMVGRLDRNSAPELLGMLHEWGLLAPDAYRLTGDVWSSSEYPDRYLRRRDWLALFDAAGFTIDGEPAERPAEPLTLYRGSVPERRRDWSWTDSLEIATGYAMGTAARRPVGAVWVAMVAPWRLLARNSGRQESEYVVNTRGLTIRQHV